MLFSGFLVFLGFSCATIGHSQPGIDVRFADYLFLRKQYKEAFFEYQRTLLMDPPSRDAGAVDRMFISGRLAGDPLLVIAAANAEELFAGRDDFACLRQFHKARAYYALKNFSEAMKILAPTVSCEAGGISDRIAYLEGLVYMRLERWADASTSMAKVAPASPIYPRFVSLASRSDPLIGAALHRKSVRIAGGLAAIVPGSGYLYAGYKQTAVAALLTNSLFIWGTVSAIKSGELGLGALGSAFSFAWYFGNIYGSIQAVNRQNQAVSDEFIGRFELD